MAAYLGLYEFVDKLAEEYKKKEDTRILTILIDYYETVLKHGKFKDQKRYCKEKIYELCPSFFKGYFKKEKP